jgi:hypothetical protein
VTKKPSLAETHPELSAQADGWDPTIVATFSHKSLPWICNLGHKWKSKVSDRSNGNNCPFCSGKRVMAGFNDLATTHLDLAEQAHGWDPTKISSGSHKKLEWECEQGHTWFAFIYNRSNGTGCPVCAGKIALLGFNDLATYHPELAAQAHGWDPKAVTVGSNRKLGWKCDQGHIWHSTVAHRREGKGCNVCANRVVLVGFNDLATTHSDLAAQAHGWDPTTVTAGSHKKLEWTCEQGHKWNSAIEWRVRGSGCLVCCNLQVLVGFNDLATTHPDLAAQAHGWDPTTIISGSPKKMVWKCEQGHKWRGRVSHRSDGVGCPSCATFGFDPNKQGFLYFMDHFDLHMFQIGITNFPENRLNDHKRRGWEVIELRGPMDGHLTQQLETSCLHALEKRGAILGHKAGIDKFDGYSEAWTRASLNVTSIKQILEYVYADEGARHDHW